MQPFAPITHNEIFRQPGVLVGLIARHDELRGHLDALSAARELSRIYAFGCGDGFFAAEAAGQAFAAAGVHGYRGLGALDFLQGHAPYVDAGCLLVPISMSGNVDRTVEGLRAGLANGASALAVTNSTTGLLAEASQSSFQLGLKEPVGFLAGTLTYTASLTTLFMLALAAAARTGIAPGQALDALAGLVRAIDGRLAGIEAAVDAAVSGLGPAERVYFLGGGSGFASARYAASKFVELTRTPAIPQDTEEFTHSSFWQFQPSDLVFVLHEPASVDRISARTAALLRDFGARVIEVAPDGADAAGRDVIRIPNPEAAWSPLALSFPIQLIACRWAQRDGLDPDTRLHLKNDELRFRINRMLSRRSLVNDPMRR